MISKPAKLAFPSFHPLQLASSFRFETQVKIFRWFKPNIQSKKINLTFCCLAQITIGLKIKLKILEYKAKTTYTTLSIRSNFNVFSYEFWPYRQCGIRCFCFVLQNCSSYGRKLVEVAILAQKYIFVAQIWIKTKRFSKIFLFLLNYC